MLPFLQKRMEKRKNEISFDKNNIQETEVDKIAYSLILTTFVDDETQDMHR
jgi:hypothetical protein